ncbi:MAG: hypothetical protein ACI9ZT_001342 [Gammaproteobacteria bacterium]|jgi:hypothetical protein
MGKALQKILSYLKRQKFGQILNSNKSQISHCLMKGLRQMVCYLESCLDYQFQGLIKCYFLAGLIVPIIRKFAIEEQIIVGLW